MYGLVWTDARADAREYRAFCDRFSERLFHTLFINKWISLWRSVKLEARCIAAHAASAFDGLREREIELEERVVEDCAEREGRSRARKSARCDDGSGSAGKQRRGEARRLAARQDDDRAAERRHTRDLLGPEVRAEGLDRLQLRRELGEDDPVRGAVTRDEQVLHGRRAVEQRHELSAAADPVDAHLWRAELFERRAQRERLVRVTDHREIDGMRLHGVERTPSHRLLQAERFTINST
jgi:hypothetical protein